MTHLLGQTEEVVSPSPVQIVAMLAEKQTGLLIAFRELNDKVTANEERLGRRIDDISDDLGSIKNAESYKEDK